MELPIIILRVLQFVFLIIITGLIGNVLYNHGPNDDPAVNFAMFTAVWSWIVAIYGLLGVFMTIVVPIVILPLEILSVIFTFVAAVVLSARLGGVNCANYDTYPYIVLGDMMRCREIQASTAFLWFLWACFVGTLVFAAMTFRSSGVTSSSVRTRPSMSQV